jgi:hypothetical protein
MADPSRRKARLLAARAQLESARNDLEAAAAARARRFATRSAQLNAQRAAKGLPGKTLRPRRWDEKHRPQAPINLTDPDSRIMLARRGRVQGSNAQLATTAEQIILAAEVTQAGNDVAQLEPMITATRTALREADIADQPRAVIADAGYRRAANVDGSIPTAPELFIPVAGHGRRDKTPTRRQTHRGEDPPPDRRHERPAQHRHRTSHDAHATRLGEPVIGQTKHGRGIRHFSRRGPGAVSAEWKLIAATDNPLKLHRARCAEN